MRAQLTARAATTLGTIVLLVTIAGAGHKWW
ncbi:hypothetical protein J2S57_002196 [Kineosporia succinea]|uniref:Uncharacterized protein n=1 Tax=Kineosporia succinea TaxID=84632 RepID=A0ABT9P182_9ACTN|nr:hypothetical protein [Kineosporia succinea]